VIDLNPENVYFIIDKMREFHAKEAVSIPEVPTSPTDDWALQVLADHLDDASYGEACAAIDDLEPDQQITLVALMWLGRGDYTLDDWEEALEDARSAYNGRTADYLIATPLVADYLEEGLNEHGYTNE
jgi:hypothetical protein